MPYEQVRCRRTINSAPEDVWACLRGFDLNWHPFVVSCSLKPGPDGAVWRDFTTSDGGHLVEQRTYISDADRVLCYTARSGIDGVISYHARIAVIHEGGHSCVTWQADIVAARARLDAIAQGTRVIFEAGLDSLANGLPPLPPPKPPKPLRVAVRRGAIDGTPRLSYLTGDVAHPKGGTLVLCVHGIGGQASNWVEQIEAFGADYTIAAMDLRGYGQSTLGFSPTQIDDYCDDICAMADHFGAKRLVLVGLSLGSWIATSFAMRHRDKLAGLVLAGGCTGMSEADPQVRQSFRDAREAPLSQGQTPADFADAVVQMIAGPNANDDLRARLHDSMSAICVETYRDALNCFCNPLETFDFANITCPVLMMTGADDRLAPPDEIRGVSVRIFEDVTAVSGHADV
ncbi:MAG: alpha/beta fold hydrolase, partial [Paracoccaceae bacterium]